MKLDTVGEVIAMRELTIAEDNTPSAAIAVLLGKPQQLPDSPGYCCPYQIKGVGAQKVRQICGVDAFQALQLALRTIAVELEVLNKDRGGRLRWECDDKGGLGFPDS
jgi:hypothetical protein